MRRALLVALLAAVALAGCGDTSGQKQAKTTPAGVTVSAYGGFAATTIPVSSAPDARYCADGARSLVGEARDFLAHSSTQAAYPADLNFMIIRDRLADLEAHRCDPAVIGRSLARGLSAAQRKTLVDGLPSAMAATLRTALARAGAG